jgi:anhydro-N-acetylmuramic acid kinase
MGDMRVIGLISGTSHDGVDACSVEFRQDGSQLRAEILAAHVVPYPADLRERIAATLPPNPTTVAEVCALDILIGEHFAEVALALDPDHECDLISSHGQTVFHWVEDGRARGGLQLGNLWSLAERTGHPVLTDLRAADIAAGGQGAPLVPVLDVLLLAGRSEAAALNLGGIANMTVVDPGSEPHAYDLGPANALVDAAVVRMTAGAQRYDDSGRYASQGRVDEALLGDLLAEPYYTQPAPKSTGKELFHDAYLEPYLARHRDVQGADLVATLTELTARLVGAELANAQVTEVFASGGGTANPVLMQRIRANAGGASVGTIEELGVPSDIKEALAFALIGYLTAHELPGNVPSCTGAAGPRVLGRLGPVTARIPRPPVPPPTRLEVV